MSIATTENFASAAALDALYAADEAAERRDREAAVARQVVAAIKAIPDYALAPATVAAICAALASKVATSSWRLNDEATVAIEGLDDLHDVLEAA